MKVLLFTTQTCPDCAVVKHSLDLGAIDYRVVDMSTPAGLTELRTLFCFELSAPILAVSEDGEKYRFYGPAALLDRGRPRPLALIDPLLGVL